MLICHYSGSFTSHFNLGILSQSKGSRTSHSPRSIRPFWSILLPTLTWGSFTSISFFIPYIYDLLTPNPRDIAQNYFLSPLSAESLLPIPYTFTHHTLSTHAFSCIYPLLGFSTVYPRRALPYFLSNQRYFTLFLSAFLSAEDFFYVIFPCFSHKYFIYLFSTLIYHSPTPTPWPIRRISTAYPRISSISPKLF